MHLVCPYCEKDLTGFSDEDEKKHYANCSRNPHRPCPPTKKEVIP